MKNKEIEELYKKFEKPLIRYISYKVSDKHIAQEILNDVFFKASKSLETLKEKEKIQSWLYKIASNQIIDHYRKRKENYQDINEELVFEEEVKEQESIIKSLDCCVNDFLKTLPNQYSNSLKAIYIDEFSQKEYAQNNDLNLSTVKSHVKRGKAHMKKFFEECCNFEKDANGKISKCNPRNSKESC